MAHLSDAMSQSFYSDIDPTFPSDLFSFEPNELTDSQTTELTPLPLPLPPSIERFGDRTKEWALWTEMTKTEFIEWWLTTEYGTKAEAKRIRWDKKGYQSDVWTQFDQVAYINTGKPRVACKQCGIMLEHPVLNGTSGMRRHLKNGLCQRKSKQSNIKHLMQKVVCLLVRAK